eukprot:24824-Eustigmatos_ZCMA.PRE.1
MEQGEPEGRAVTLSQLKLAEHSHSQPPQQPAVDTDGLDWEGARGDALPRMQPQFSPLRSLRK